MKKTLKLTFALTGYSSLDRYQMANQEGNFWNRRRVYCLLSEECYLRVREVLSDYGWELTDKEFKRNPPDFPDADELIVCSFEQQ